MLRKKFLTDFFSYGLVGVLGKFISLFSLPIYASYLSPEEFGVLEIVILVLSLLMMVGSFQVESSLLRLFYDSDDKCFRRMLYSTGFYFCLISSSILVALVLVLYFLSGVSPPSQVSTYIIVLTLLQLPFKNIYGYASVLLRVQYRKKSYILLNSLQIIVNVALGLCALVLLDMGLQGVLLSQLITIVVFSAASVFLTKKMLGRCFDRFIFMSMLKYSGPLIPSSLMLYAQQFLSRIFILSSLSLTELGIYSIAAKVASPLLLVAGVIKMSWTPLAFDHYKDESEKKSYGSILDAFMVVGVFVIISVSLFSIDVVSLLFDKRYLDSVPIIVVISYSLYLKGIQNVLSPGMGVVKKTYYLSAATILGMCVSLLFMFLLVEEFKLLGVVYGAVIGEVVGSIVLLILVSKYFKGYFNARNVLFGIIFPLTIVISTETLSVMNIKYKLVLFLTALTASVIYVKRLKSAS